MEKFAKVFISIALVTIMLFTLTACGGLNGTYVATAGEIGDAAVSVELTFNNGELTMKMDSMEIKGTYEVKDNQITMTMTMFGQESVSTSEFKQEGNSIWIDNVEYKKK